MDIDEALALHHRLTNEGWRRRFTSQESRALEMKEFYESLGFEALIVPGGIPEEGRECTECLNAMGFSDLYRTVYTRGEAEPRDDELFHDQA
ncbi:MAG: hypothetical protein V2B18_08065 [Pseudomonadota bacterium]